jgi:hypothetical protein
MKLGNLMYIRVRLKVDGNNEQFREDLHFCSHLDCNMLNIYCNREFPVKAVGKNKMFYAYYISSARPVVFHIINPSTP